MGGGTDYFHLQLSAGTLIGIECRSFTVYSLGFKNHTVFCIKWSSTRSLKKKINYISCLLTGKNYKEDSIVDPFFKKKKTIIFPLVSFLVPFPIILI